MFSTRVKPTKLTKRERKAVVACAKVGGTVGDVFRCTERKLDLTPSSMTSDQYVRIQAASHKAQRSANRAAIHKSSLSGARRRKSKKRRRK